MMNEFNSKIAGGKWGSFQLQPHIDYGDVARYGPDALWQQPQLNNVAIPDVMFPAVRRISLPPAAALGAAIDGSASWWPGEQARGEHGAEAVLPALSPYRAQPAPYVDVFNRGQKPFDFRIQPGAPWLRVEPDRGRVTSQVRAVVSADWSRAPRGTTRVPITITCPGGGSVIVQAPVD